MTAAFVVYFLVVIYTFSVFIFFVPLLLQGEKKCYIRLSFALDFVFHKCFDPIICSADTLRLLYAGYRFIRLQLTSSLRAATSGIA